MNLCPVPVEPRPDPSSTLWFLRAGLNSSTISRFELKPPVATTTALLRTTTGSPVLPLRPTRPVTRPPSRASPPISGPGTHSPPFLRELFVRGERRPERSPAPGHGATPRARPHVG